MEDNQIPTAWYGRTRLVVGAVLALVMISPLSFLVVFSSGPLMTLLYPIYILLGALRIELPNASPEPLLFSLHGGLYLAIGFFAFYRNRFNFVFTTIAGFVLVGSYFASAVVFYYVEKSFV